MDVKIFNLININLKLHHLGIATKNIQQTELFVKTMI